MPPLVSLRMTRDIHREPAGRQEQRREASKVGRDERRRRVGHRPSPPPPAPATPESTSANGQPSAAANAPSVDGRSPIMTPSGPNRDRNAAEIDHRRARACPRPPATDPPRSTHRWPPDGAGCAGLPARRRSDTSDRDWWPRTGPTPARGAGRDGSGPSKSKSHGRTRPPPHPPGPGIDDAQALYRSSASISPGPAHAEHRGARGQATRDAASARLRLGRSCTCRRRPRGILTGSGARRST